MRKSRYEKFEEMLGEIFQEKDIDIKIYKKEEEIRNIQMSVPDEIDYSDDSIEDNEKNRELIRRLEKQLDFYKIFRDNQKQILNIREYQRASQEQLDLLQNELASLSEKSKLIGEVLRKEKKEITNVRNKNIKKQAILEKELARKDLSQEEIKKLREEFNSLSDEMDKNYKRYVEFMEGDKFKAKREQYEEFKKRIIVLKRKITKLEITLSECNAIWSSLLKGKNWDEIKVILKEGNFTAPKGTNYKIYRIAQLNGENEFLNKEEIHKIESSVEQEKEITDKTREEISSFVTETLEKEKKHEEAEAIKEKSKEMFYNNIRKQRIQMERMRRSHNFFYRSIPFLARIINKIDERKIDKELSYIYQYIVPNDNTTVDVMSLKDVKEVWTRILETREKDEQNGKKHGSKVEEKEYNSEIEYLESQRKNKKIELYRQIAGKGLSQAVGEDKQKKETNARKKREAFVEQYKQNKEKLAEELDKKFEEQDGEIDIRKSKTYIPENQETIR